MNGGDWSGGDWAVVGCVSAAVLALMVLSAWWGNEPWRAYLRDRERRERDRRL